ILGTGLFEFNKGEHKKFVTAFIFAENIDELILNKTAAMTFYKNDFSNKGFQKIPISILNLSSLKVLNGNVDVEWAVPNYSSQDLTIVILISSDGVTYNYYKTSKDNSDKFIFETTRFPDGIFYKIKLVCYNKTEYGEFITPNYIVINNEGIVPPQLKFVTPTSSGNIIRDSFKIEWISGDADSDPFTVSLYYGIKETNTWTLIEKNLPSEKNEFLWNTKLVPNGSTFCFKALLNGNTDSSIKFSERFSIQNDRKFVDARLYSDATNARGTGEFLFSLIDPSQFTNDTYLLKFVKLADSTSVGYMVNNITKNSHLIEPTMMINNLESKQFDGIRLIVNDDKRKDIVASQSKWISGSCNFILGISPDQSTPSRNVYQPYDYKLTFYDANVYTTPFTKQLINLKVRNLTENKDVDCELFDNDKNGKLNAGDDIVLVEYPEGTNFKLSWRIKFNNPVSGTPIPPKGNDEFIFVSSKPFRVGDEIKFSTVNIPVGIHNENSEVPSKFILQQNFPNPFNPSTTIKYSVTQTARISLKVFDVLGREVTTLVNAIKSPGEYSVAFNAKNLPSGVYFYKLSVGDFHQTMKMLLLK
ncbi:MAG: T9SS type A sorting domain-containing protein, partial [Ignavibacteria bacterium]|nr:T9SS type A sorting domain-containing protein [Ignavibacteria bacterium]